MTEYRDALDRTPDNANFMSPLRFRFQIKKTPSLNFYVQNVNIPGIHTPPWDNNTPFNKIPQPGDHIEWDDIMINFKVDENFQNYREIWNWMIGIGYPKNFQQHAAINPKVTPTVPFGEGIKSDLSLIIMNSANKVIFDVTFVDAFPVSLSSLIFDSTREDINYIDAAATFRYTYYEINDV